MQRYKVSESKRASWEDYPVRIKGVENSGCCGSPTLLVETSQGGFVKEMCSTCRTTDTLSKSDFLTISHRLHVECPECGGEMAVDTEGSRTWQLCLFVRAVRPPAAAGRSGAVSE